MNKKMNLYLFMITSKIKMNNIKISNHFKQRKKEKMNKKKINNRFKMARKVEKFKTKKRFLKVNNLTKILKITQIKKINWDFLIKQEKK